MALIKCPECGKENISDSAPTCPECGFAVREYFEDAKKKAQEAQAKEAEIRFQKHRLEHVEKPERPHYSIAIAIVGVLVMLLGGSSFALYDSYDVAYSVAHGNGDPHFQGGCLIVFGIAILAWGLYSYCKKKEKYLLAQSNFEQYQREIIKQEDVEGALLLKKMGLDPAAPKCPHCQSTNIRSISTASRALSVGMVGLASSKIGKTMECKNCGYKW